MRFRLLSFPEPQTPDKLDAVRPVAEGEEVVARQSTDQLGI